MTDWTRESVLRRMREVLDPAEYEMVIEHLEDRSTGSEAAWLLDVVEASAELPLPAVPEHVSVDLRALFNTRFQRPRHEATLVNDSRLERSLAGVRAGGDPSVEDGWTLSYLCPVGRVLIDVWPSVATSWDADDEHHVVEAQLLAISGETDFNLIVVGDDESSAAPSDRLGRARTDLRRFGAMTLRLTTLSADIDVALDIDDPGETVRGAGDVG